MNDIRLDIVPGTKFKIYQQKGQFSYTTDSLALSGFAKPKGKVIDLGAGTGILCFRMANNKNVTKIVAVEKNPITFDLLNKSININGLNKIISSYNMGINEIIKQMGKASFNTVITNPPYFLKEGGITKRNLDLKMAMHETDLSLADWLRISSELLVPKGSLYMINRPNRLQDIMYYARKGRLEIKEIRFIKNTQKALAKAVLIKAIKNGGNGMKLLSDLILYDDSGNMTKDYLNYYQLSNNTQNEVQCER
ncbi:MAG: methyltransferase [Tissierellia bacterium]|nr:methyltransferase [Tissierellia bacterium]